MPNQNPQGLSPETLNAMLKMASSKLGMTPEQLKSAVSDPERADSLLSAIDKSSGGKVSSTISGTGSLEEFLRKNPRAKKLMEELTGGRDTER